MPIKISPTITATVIALLVAAMMLGYSRGIAAQQDQPTPGPTLEQALKELQDVQRKQQGILSGEDVGFRLNPGNAQGNGAAQGQLMVRVNGQWVEAQFATRVQMASTK